MSWRSSEDWAHAGKEGTGRRGELRLHPVGRKIGRREVRGGMWVDFLILEGLKRKTTMTHDGQRKKHMPY